MGSTDWDPSDEFDPPIPTVAQRLARRIVASIATCVAWLAGTLLFFAFAAGGLTFAQGIVVGFVSLLLLFGALAAIWVSFGLSFVRGWPHW